MPKKIDMINKKFGNLTVLKESLVRGTGNQIKYICQCDCNNTTEVFGYALRNGNTKTCGSCQVTHNAIYNDITGLKFNKLLVLNRVNEKSIDGKIQYLCQCDCGNTIIVRKRHLISNHTTSCGCIVSKGETKLKNILDNNNINYKQQYSFQDLKDKLPLRFDFAIFDINNNLIKLIEFNGLQHYNKNSKYYTIDGLNKDQMKREYCIKNNIPLMIIPYHKLNTLSLETLNL